MKKMKMSIEPTIFFLETRVGFEPTKKCFADISDRPLQHRVINKKKPSLFSQMELGNVPINMNKKL